MEKTHRLKARQAFSAFLSPHLNLQLTPHRTLTIVLALRCIVVVAQLVVLALAVEAFHVPLAQTQILAGIAFLAFTAVLLWLRLRSDYPVTELEVSLHQLTDVAVLTWLLYLTGGSSNPFISAYLVPIALAATALRPWLATMITIACIGAYTFLFGYNIPLPMPFGQEGDFELHVFGMWVNFLFNACLIVALLGLMAANIRSRDQLISRAREETLRNEHVTALGVLAAGAAHELSTPLSTVGLIADELSLECKDNPSALADLALLKEQLQQCKTSLTTLLASAGHKRLESSEPLDLDAFLQSILERWQLLRPEINLSAKLTGERHVELLPESGISQALINLLNNAGEASLAAGSHEVILQARCEQEKLVIEIRDYGKGIDQATRQIAGQQVFTTKPGGVGLGLMLSNATLSRFDGTLSLQEHSGGGTLTRVVLPLRNLTVIHDAELD